MSATTLQADTLPTPLTGERADSAPALRSIVFAGDGSPESRVARAAATDLALRSGATVHVVAAFIGGLPAAFIDDDSPHDPWRIAHELLRTDSEAIQHAGVSATTHLGVRSASEATANVAAQVDADLIVVGGRDLAGVLRLLVGSKSGEVVTAAHRPVLVLRDSEQSWPPGRVIIGFDHSPAAVRAARVAAAIATLYPGVEVTLLRAVPPTSKIEAAPDLQAVHMEFGDLIQSEREYLARHAEALARSTGAKVTADVVTGAPAAALLNAAREAGGPVVLVVGTRGLGRVKRFMLGSVSSRVLHHACVPTLVVPGNAAWISEEHDAA
ncbi:MAG: universal stress protein [Candidatus Dormibacteraeota bacterium]|nr:universal stress protein [Candidatus Dormibacteraeota bacterium]